MPEVSLTIPAIGEGLQEARVVALLKQPGDQVRRDEVIYQMETDKAVMDVESSHDGTLLRWLAAPDDVLPIGAPVLILQTQSQTESQTESQTQTPRAQPETTQPGSQTSGQIALAIPAIGEGLQEARLVAKLKQPGDQVKRDEIIYQMETDKAVMDVECPYQGTVVQWLAEVDDLIPIGADVLLLQTDEATTPTSTTTPASKTTSNHPPKTNTSNPAQPPTPANPAQRRRDIPPKTRAHAKKKGLTEEQLNAIPAAGSKLLPEDVDAFLAGGFSITPAARAATSSGKPFAEKPLPSRQRVLASRLVRGNQLVVPGMMSVVADWGPIEARRQAYKDSGADFAPSAFTLFAYCVARAAADHPIVRSTLVGEGTVRTYQHLQLGIAVALPEDQLVVAVVEDADTLDWPTFANQARESISAARNGQDQANEAVTLSITNMQGYGIREAMAVVVPPGVVTVFLGEAYNGLANTLAPDGKPEIKPQRCANIGVTIDHRLINGVGGAEFLNTLKNNVENIDQLLGIA